MMPQPDKNTSVFPHTRIDRSTWKRVRLGDVCEISKGEQLNRATLSERGRIPVYNGGSSPSGYAKESNTDAESIIISEGGNSCGYVNFVHTPFWRGGHCYLLKTDIDKALLYYILKANEPKIMSLRVGTGLPNIQRERLNSFEFNLPTSKVQQQQIILAFTSIDANIAALQSLVIKYEAIKKATVNLLLKPKAGWKRVKLGVVCELSTRTIPTMCINQKDYVGTENMLQNCQGVVPNLLPVPYKRVRAFVVNDILISNIRPYLRKIWLSDKDGGCSSDVNVVHCVSQEISSKYIYYVLIQDRFFDFVTANAIGTKMPRGDKSTIKAFEFSCPSSAVEQCMIDEQITAIDNVLAAHKAQLEKAQQLKLGMMSYFFG